MIEAEILLPLPCSIFHCLWVSTSIHLHPVLDSVLQPSDPVLVDLDELARRAPHSAAHRFNSALRKAAVAAVLQKGCAHPQSLARHSLKRRHACTTEQRTSVRLWGCAFVAFWFSFRTCPKIPPEREKGDEQLTVQPLNIDSVGSGLSRTLVQNATSFPSSSMTLACRWPRLWQ